jgi:predicted transcriptional regulator
MNNESNQENFTIKTAEQGDIVRQNIHDIEVAVETDNAEMMYVADMNKSLIKKNCDHLADQGLVNQVNIDDTLVACQVTYSGLLFLDSLTRTPETID